MAAIFQLRRGTTASKPTLASGEFYMDTDTESLYLGIDNAGDEIVLAKLNDSNAGNFIIAGNLTVGGTITAPIITAINTKFATIEGQSGSWVGGNTDIGPLNDFSSSVNIWSGSINTKFITLENVTASLEQYTASVNIRLNNLESTTSSLNTKFNTLATQSGSWITNTTELNNFTQSLLGTNTWTSSIDQKFNNIEGQSGSWGLGGSTDITLLNQHSASVNTFTGSANSRLNNLESFTSSINTTIKTKMDTDGVLSGSAQVVRALPTGTVSGSSQITYTSISSIPAGIVSGAAQVTPLLPTGTVSGSSQVSYTGLSNIPSGIISGAAQLNGTTITNLTITNLTTVNETASVIFSSGSNRFGDFGNDVHEFTGSVQISGSQTLIGNLSATTLSGTINANNGVISGSSQLTASYDGRYLRTGSFNSFTQSLQLWSGSIDTSILNLNQFTESVAAPTNITLLNQFTGSANSRLNNLELFTGSIDTTIKTKLDVEGVLSGSAQITAFGFVSSSVTASLLVTASVSSNTITFTKGNGDTFDITLAGGGGSIPAGTISGSAQITAFGFISSSTIQTSGSTIYSTNPATTNFTQTDGVFIGYEAGVNSTAGDKSVFVGYQAGWSAANAYHSNFIGQAAGFQASGADRSNFIGSQAGDGATNARFSNFIGFSAGYGQTAASYSNVFGYRAGYTNTLGSNNIIIGTNITFENNRKDSINLGGVIFATGSHSNTLSSPFAGAVTDGKVGINISLPQAALHVSGAAILTNTFTASLSEGYTWVGGVGNVTTLVATSSFGGGGSTDITLLNQHTASINTYTGSVNSRLNNLELNSASQDSRLDNLELFTGSTNSRLNAIESVSGAWITESETGSFELRGNNIVSASSDTTNVDITITAGVISADLKGGVVSSSLQIIDILNPINSFTQSLLGTNTWTASINEKFNTIETQSGSWGAGTPTDITLLNQHSASLNTYTGSANSRFTNIELFTASTNSRLNAIENVSGTWVTEAETASFFTNASVNLNTITFTKGNGTTQNITVDTGSLPAGLVSGSSQVSYLGLSNIPAGIVSGAIQVLGGSGVFSSSAQITGFETTGRGIVSSSVQVIELLPAGTVSGSAQVIGILSSLNSYTQSNDTTNTNQNNRLTEIENYTSSLKNAIGLNGTNVTVFGDLTVNGTTTQINSTQVNIGENILELNYGGSAATAGIYTKDATGGSTVSGSLLWDSNTDLWIAGKKGSEAKILTDGMGVISGSGQLGDYETTGRGIISSSAQITAFGFVSGSYVTTSSFNNYTASISTASLVSRLDAIESTTSSLNTYTSSANSRFTNIELFTASANSRLNSIESVSGSWVTSNITGSSLVTASAALNIITFTKGNNDTFNITIDTGSFGLPAGVVSGSSQLTASYDIRYELQGSSIVSGAAQVTPLLPTGTVSGSSQVISILSSLNSYTQSNDTTNTNQNNRLTSLESATSSLFTSASLGLVTASYSGTTLTFTKGDTTQFSVSISTGSAATASIAEQALDVVVNVKNMTGGQLNKGTVVRIIGSQVSSDVALIGTASWENDGSSANTLGFLMETLPHDSFGRVITQGVLTGINTDGFTGGQMLYLSSSGQYTNVKPPAPYHEVRIGQVLRTHQNQGSVFISVMNGYELEELHDVDINTGTLLNNNLVAWNSTATQWVNKTVTEVGATTTASFHSYTSSTNIRLDALETVSNSWVRESETGSFYVAAGYDSEAQLLHFTDATGSVDSVDMGSLLKRTDTGSLLTTASAAGNTITFTKGNSETFSVTVSGGTLPAGTISGSSQLTSSFDERYVLTGSFDTLSASVDGRLDNLESFTSSIDTTIKNKLNAETVVSSSAQITSLGFISSSANTGFVVPTFNPLPSNPATGSMAISASVDSIYTLWVHLGVGYNGNGDVPGWQGIA
jgi:hypothetical protein